MYEEMTNYGSQYFHLASSSTVFSTVNVILIRGTVNWQNFPCNYSFFKSLRCIFTMQQYFEIRNGFLKEEHREKKSITKSSIIRDKINLILGSCLSFSNFMQWVYITFIVKNKNKQRGIFNVIIQRVFPCPNSLILEAIWLDSWRCILTR